ncbi:50S ribosomal protein L18 [Synoicihabitans lomoniglobus]|uniref:Large ribosomal subunit protein uL18 n=1 Tax=Synoicihabitans lomoniglobus TaxID=2909285 RepID=A0AAE9ZZE6_9BACT|nr:50S ribosomal protein L18 [Opitutaceae bacterium LMO-M01]WED65633.1 50S ribosomal protein L18 [Opitutaceae bacterium LMO-M01]
MKTILKAKLLQKRKWRIRKKVNGTAARPRLTVKFTSKHIYAQAVDDDAGTTLAYLSSLDAELRKQKLAANVAGAQALAQAFTAKATAAGISDVVFDRNGALYHGKVKAFADAAREAGLKF